MRVTCDLGGPSRLQTGPAFGFDHLSSEHLLSTYCVLDSLGVQVGRNRQRFLLFELTSWGGLSDNRQNKKKYVRWN